MRIRTCPNFDRCVKRLHPAEKIALDDAVRAVLADPTLGEAKKGDLLGVSVYKYKLNRQEVLLSYRASSDELLLLAIGSHENYYRDLKRLQS